MLIRRDRGMLAVTIMLEVAFHGGRTATVNAGDIADRLGVARRGLEPLLQMLSRGGLLESLRGPRGGYRLARPGRDIGLASIIGAVSQIPSSDDCEPADGPAGALQVAVVDPLWSEIDQVITAELQALTLDDLMKRAAAAGLRRPQAEPISFAI